MRATCGVISARTPSKRPESGSVSLKVCSSRSRPVPVSSESRCSISGGCTRRYPWSRKWSRSVRRRLSSRSASAGRISSICSGSIHLRIKKYQEDATDDDGDQPDETKLSVGKIGEPAKRIAPGARSDQRQQSLEHKYQRARCQERFRHRLSGEIVTCCGHV